MKILFLISQLPYPLDTGAKIRSFNLIKNLSHTHFITLVAFGDRDKDGEKIQKLEKFCQKIEIVPHRVTNIYLAVLKNLFSRYPYSIDKYFSKEMSKKIRGLLEKENFDLIHCDSLQVSLNVLKFNHIPRVLTEHNIESQILRRVVRNESNLFKKFYFYLQYLKLKRYEIFTCEQFCHVLTVSEEDKGFLANFISPEGISVVPNGVDTEYFSPQSTVNSPQTEKKSLVFTGSMDWPPNDDAMVYFIKRIYPLIKEEAQKVSLTIVGRKPSTKLLQLASQDNSIELTGRVNDVRPYIQKGYLFIVPLRIGGGTRLKILEALAMEKAVVSTSVGCEGLEVTDGKNIIVADSPTEFAKKVLALFNNEGLREQLGKAGRRRVEKTYDWKIISDKLYEVWRNTTHKVKLPILLYHDICDDGFDISKAKAEQRPYILSEVEFEKQMKYLHDQRYKTIGLNEFFNEQLSLQNNKTVIISFDDGLASNYEKAFPILKRYSLKAIFFVTAGKVGRDNMMTWSQIKELREAGMEIGSHSLTHAMPSELKEKELEYELKESRRILEENLKTGIDYFSSPTGFFNPLLPGIAKKTGYKAVLVSNPCLNRVGKSFILNKTSVKRSYSFEKFVSIMKQDGSTFKDLCAQQRRRNRLKKVLRPGAYDLFRSIILRGTK